MLFLSRRSVIWLHYHAIFVCIQGTAQRVLLQSDLPCSCSLYRSIQSQSGLHLRPGKSTITMLCSVRNIIDTANAIVANMAHGEYRWPLGASPRLAKTVHRVPFAITSKQCEQQGVRQWSQVSPWLNWISPAHLRRCAITVVCQSNRWGFYLPLPRLLLPLASSIHPAQSRSSRRGEDHERRHAFPLSPE